MATFQSHWACSSRQSPMSKVVDLRLAGELTTILVIRLTHLVMVRLVYPPPVTTLF